MTDRYKEAIQGARDCVERNKDGGVYLPDLLVVIDSQQTEIERLQGAVQEWVDGKCLSQKHLLMIGNLQNEIEQAKAEAIEECLDRVEVFLCGVCSSVVEDNPNLDRILFGYNTEEVDTFIDNLRKEMVGEQ